MQFSIFHAYVLYASQELPRLPESKETEEEVVIAQKPEPKDTSKEVRFSHYYCLCFCFTVTNHIVQKILGYNGYYSKEQLLKNHLEYFKQLRQWFQEGENIRMHRYKERLAKIDELRRRRPQFHASDGTQDRNSNMGIQTTPPRSSSSEGGLEFLSAVAASPAGRSPDLHHKRLRHSAGIDSQNFMNDLGIGNTDYGMGSVNENGVTTDIGFFPQHSSSQTGAKRRKQSVFSPYSEKASSSIAPTTAWRTSVSSHASNSASPSFTAAQAANRLLSDAKSDQCSKEPATNVEAQSFLSPPPSLRNREAERRGSRTNSASHALALLSQGIPERHRDTEERSNKPYTGLNTKRRLRATQHCTNHDDNGELEADPHQHFSIPNVRRSAT